MTSRRHEEWHLVGLGEDPVPASQSDVERVAQDYGRRAEQLDTAHRTLRSLSGLEGWRGKAASAFAEEAEEHLGDLAKAKDKYEETATALQRYAARVDTARTRTLAAVRDAREAHATMQANEGDALAGVEEPTPAEVDEERRRASAHSAASTALDAARRELQAAVSELEEAAEACAARIEEASDRFADSRWDDFKGWVRDNAGLLRVLLNILEIVAVALAVLAIVFGGWVIFLAALAVAATIVAVTAAMVAADEATMGDLVAALAGLALTIVGGRLAMRLASQTTRLLRSTMRTAESALRLQARQGPLISMLLRRSMVNPLRWVGGGLARLRGSLDVSALRGTVGAITATPGQVARLADRAGATDLARIQHLAANFDVGADVARQAASLSSRFAQNGYLTYGTIGDTVLANVEEGLGALGIDTPIPIAPSTGLGAGVDGLVDALPSIRPERVG